jgi:hypothetical protein
MSSGKNTGAQKYELLQGTLDLMLLKVLDALSRCTDINRPPDRASERPDTAIDQ